MLLVVVGNVHSTVSQSWKTTWNWKSFYNKVSPHFAKTHKQVFFLTDNIIVIYIFYLFQRHLNKIKNDISNCTMNHHLSFDFQHCTYCSTVRNYFLMNIKQILEDTRLFKFLFFISEYLTFYVGPFLVLVRNYLG